MTTETGPVVYTFRDGAWVVDNGDGTAPQDWADLGAYNNALYGYFVELYDIDFNAIALLADSGGLASQGGFVLREERVS